MSTAAAARPSLEEPSKIEKGRNRKRNACTNLYANQIKYGASQGAKAEGTSRSIDSTATSRRRALQKLETDGLLRSGDSYHAAGFSGGLRADPLSSSLPVSFMPTGRPGVKVTFDGTTFERTKFHLMDWRIVSTASSRVVIDPPGLRTFTRARGERNFPVEPRPRR
jgi:hypothetical protein